MSEWISKSIDDLKSSSKNAIAMGPFGSRITKDNFVSDGVPVIRGGNLNADRFNGDDFVFLTEQKADELRASNAYPLDIIITHRGTLGQVGIIPNDQAYPRYVVSQSQLKITIDQSKADPHFIFYFLRSPDGQFQLLANTSQTGVPSIASPTKSIKDIRLNLPPLDEQRAIAHILGTLDDKIELNRRMNETLEGIARALFKSWFIDFDPVRAKAEGRQPFGMDEETAALFPSEFEDSELGEIPKGWSARRIGDVLELAYGKPLKTEDREGGNIPVYGSNGIVGWHNSELVKGPGIIVGRKGNPGTVNWSSVDFYPIDTTFYVVPKGDFPISFLFQLLTTQNLAHLSADSAVPGLNRNHVYQNLVIIPEASVIKKFVDIHDMILDKCHCLAIEIDLLARLRDNMLPKLISGKIRIDPSKFGFDSEENKAVEV